MALCGRGFSLHSSVSPVLRYWANGVKEFSRGNSSLGCWPCGAYYFVVISPNSPLSMEMLQDVNWTLRSYFSLVFLGHRVCPSTLSFFLFPSASFSNHLCVCAFSSQVLSSALFTPTFLSSQPACPFSCLQEPGMLPDPFTKFWLQYSQLLKAHMGGRPRSTWTPEIHSRVH